MHPPLPRGRGGEQELPSTDTWCKSMPVEYSSKASMGWWDLRQPRGSEEDALLQNPDAVSNQMESSEHENWWPGLGRWRLGMKMEDAIVEFDKGEFWS